MTRRECVMKAPKKVLPFNEFIDRIRKTFYYGKGSNCEYMYIPSPLAQYASDRYSENHRGTSLNRLTKIAVGSTQCYNPCSLIMALIYLDRLNSNYVQRITPNDLFIISMMVSTKLYTGNDENDYYLRDWAKNGNMTKERIKKLELEFLCALDWDLYISNEEFFLKLEKVEKDLARREGIDRGWLTYTELLNFLPSFTLAKFLLNNIALLAVSYCASIMTIAGAFFLVSNIPGNGLLKSNRDKYHNTNDLINVDTNDKLPTNADDLITPLYDNETELPKNYSTVGLNIEKELGKLFNRNHIENNIINDKKSTEVLGKSYDIKNFDIWFDNYNITNTTTVFEDFLIKHVAKFTSWYKFTYI